MYILHIVHLTYKIKTIFIIFLIKNLVILFLCFFLKANKHLSLFDLCRETRLIDKNYLPSFLFLSVKQLLICETYTVYITDSMGYICNISLEIEI